MDNSAICSNECNETFWEKRKLQKKLFFFENKRKNF